MEHPDHPHRHKGDAEGQAVDNLTLQKNVTFHLVDGHNGHKTAYFSYPTLPNTKSTFRLSGCFWTYKYYFESSATPEVDAVITAGPTFTTATHHHHQHQPHSGPKIESDACQMYLYLIRSPDNSPDIELQLYCDSGSKASIGGWTLTQMKWVSIKISFINPETKQIVSYKKVEGETRCGKVLCQCRQAKLCLRKANFCSAEYLQSLFVINKCSKPRYGMGNTYYCSLDAFVSVTFYPHNPKSVAAVGATSVHDLYWKSQQEASKRIFHAKIGTDFKLEANGKQFPCHKCILAGHSEVFSKMFLHESSRARHHQHLQHSCSPIKRLVMENMSVVGVESFLKYLYYGDTSFTELPSGFKIAFELLMAAEKYSIPHLRRASLEILQAKSSDDVDCGTALNMYLFAVNNNNNLSQYSSLKKLAFQCFTKNYVDLVKSEEFVKLFVENRESAQEILIKIHKTRKS